MTETARNGSRCGSTPRRKWIKRAAQSVLPGWLFAWCIKIRRDHWGGKRRVSYAESGEDLLLASLVGEGNRGFYVDVGAHHPKRISNTCYFYRRGWRGINIDPSPGMKRLFDAYRPRDINLECGVAREPGIMVYYMFDESELNGFSMELSEERVQIGGFHLVGQKEVEVVPLNRILDEHLPPGVEIDFLSVDVEGMDLDVLVSNDWSRYRPRFVLVEIKGDLADVQASPVHALLVGRGYHLRGKTVKTAVFALGRNGSN